VKRAGRGSEFLRGSVATYLATPLTPHHASSEVFGVVACHGLALADSLTGEGLEGCGDFCSAKMHSPESLL
jgi:hypothetical protein